MMDYEDETTNYSEEIPGDRKNYNWRARFDYTAGTLGISQVGDGELQRVLLSRKQVQALIVFYQNQEKQAKKQRNKKR